MFVGLGSAPKFIKKISDKLIKLKNLIPGGDNDDPAHHHPQEGLPILLIGGPQDGVRRWDWGTLQDSGLVVQPKADLDSQVAAEDDCCVTSEILNTFLQSGDYSTKFNEFVIKAKC